MPRLEVEVPATAAGQRIDRWLGAKPEVGSRSRARRLIDEGRVSVDGEAPRPSRLVQGGEAVVLDLPEREPAGPGVAPAVPLVLLDERIAVVDKPAGLVVHPARGHSGPTLVDALEGIAGGGEASRPGIVHRLDRGTSGLMLVARDEEAHRALSRMIAAREVEREYAALVRGRPESRTGTVTAPIGRDPGRPTRMAVGGRSAREATTHFEVVEPLPRASLLKVRLETGRTHQIRAHLSAIGLPVLGDATYGEEGACGLSRQFLHSARLRLRHPFAGSALDLTSPLPEDLARALERAREGC